TPASSTLGPASGVLPALPALGSALPAVPPDPAVGPAVNPAAPPAPALAPAPAPAPAPALTLAPAPALTLTPGPTPAPAPAPAPCTASSFGRAVSSHAAATNRSTTASARAVGIRSAGTAVDICLQASGGSRLDPFRPPSSPLHPRVSVRCGR